MLVVLGLNVASIVTSAGAPACVVEVLTVSAACAAGVIRKKQASVAKRRFTPPYVPAFRATQISGWYSPKTSRSAPQTSPTLALSLSAWRIGGSRLSRALGGVA